MPIKASADKIKNEMAKFGNPPVFPVVDEAAEAAAAAAEAAAAAAEAAAAAAEAADTAKNADPTKFAARLI
jgi:leucyl-tRNA synthetase